MIIDRYVVLLATEGQVGAILGLSCRLGWKQKKLVQTNISVGYPSKLFACDG